MGGIDIDTTVVTELVEWNVASRLAPGNTAEVEVPPSQLRVDRLGGNVRVSDGYDAIPSAPATIRQTSSTGTQGERAASQITDLATEYGLGIGIVPPFEDSYRRIAPQKQAKERELCDTGTGSTIGEHTRLWPRGISSAKPSSAVSAGSITPLPISAISVQCASTV